jgi:glucosyl-dolichyl phosphate glucuronosyltransferase
MENPSSSLQPTAVIETAPALSVVICTYNRADRLLLALEALDKQTFPRQEFEILVIDNRSTDDTSSICATFDDRLTNFRYLYEPIQGLSKARNTGWQAAKSAYVAYLDDDAIPCEQWVEAIVQTFETVQPQPASIGGPIYPLWEVPKPDWISPLMETLFTILDSGDTPRWFAAYEFPWGANVVYRRDALEKNGGFCEQLGRNGKSLLSGEELLLNEALKSAGEQFYYAPQAWVSHWVPKERIDLEWLVQRSYWQGCSVAVVDQELGKSPLRQRLSSAWNLLKSIVSLCSLFNQFWPDPKVRNQIRLWDQIRLVLSWKWGYFSKTWLG